VLSADIDLLRLYITLAGAYGEIEGSVFAVPAIAEKGRMNTKVMVSTPGGHSSIPPPHTVSHHVF
jgi:Gly-Xaa carboxypeptidase